MDTTQITAAEVSAGVGEKARRPWKLPGKKGRRLKWLPAVLAAGAALWWLFLRPGGDPAQGQAQYLPVKAAVEDLTVSVSGTGTVTPMESYQVSALSRGEILQAPFEVGDQIRQGALLYQLDTGEAQSAIDQAQLSLRQAQLSYDTLAAGLTVRAQSGGVVQQVHVQKGDPVSPGTPIADIADTSSLLLALPFHTADASDIAPGQEAQVTLSGTLETLPGRVEAVSSADLVGAGGALVRQVEIRVENPGALTPGQSATACVGDLSCAGSGTLQASSRQTVTAQGTGDLTQLYIMPGSEVSPGTALAQLGGQSADASLENAAIGVETARLALQRAQDALEEYTITSPISGTVIEKNYKAGDKMDGMESGALAVIFDLSRLKLQLSVSELNIGRIQPGQQVEITAEALPGQVFHGTVDAVSINGTTANGFTTYPVTIVLEDFGSLNPGMNVSARIITDRVSGALCVPVSAVSGDSTVLVAGPGALTQDGSALLDLSKAERRAVTLGPGDEEFVSVTAGLEEGDVVLVPIQSAGAEAGSGAALAGG